MREHRVRLAKAIDGSNKDHLFVEVRQDEWLEVSEKPTHTEIEEWDKNDKTRNWHPIPYATRAFNIGLIRDWVEQKSITETEEE